MTRGYKVVFASMMRKLDLFILDAIIENKGWEEIFDAKGLTYEKVGN